MRRPTTSLSVALTTAFLLSIAGIAGCGATDDRSTPDEAELREAVAAGEVEQSEQELGGFLRWFLKKLRDKYGTIVSVTIDANGPGGAYEGQFDTLIAALKAADPAVLKTLDGYRQHTVFAPTDDAFAKLGLDETSVGTLDKTFLTNVLLYHATKGRKYASRVLKSSELGMLDGNKIYPAPDATITDGAGQQIKIIATNIATFNGVIHAIDTVLLPAPL